MQLSVLREHLFGSHSRYCNLRGVRALHCHRGCLHWNSDVSSQHLRLGAGAIAGLLHRWRYRKLGLKDDRSCALLVRARQRHELHSFRELLQMHRT